MMYWVSEYVLKIKTLGNELESTKCLIIEENKLIYVLRWLDENFDSISVTATDKILNEHVIIDYMKALLLNHESILESRRVEHFSASFSEFEYQESSITF